jgi:uncharacterized phage protein (TIGR02216 family)
MQAGLGLLRLSPETFWAMTLRELDAALRGAFGRHAGKGAMERSALSALMARYPD